MFPLATSITASRRDLFGSAADTHPAAIARETSVVAGVMITEAASAPDTSAAEASPPGGTLCAGSSIIDPPAVQLDATPEFKPPS